MGFVNGTVRRSTSSTTNAKAWKRVNNVVMGWLLSIIDEKIANTLQWLKTAKDIWDELEERYGQTSCAQLFSIQKRISKTVQSTNESFFSNRHNTVNCVRPLRGRTLHLFAGEEVFAFFLAVLFLRGSPRITSEGTSVCFLFYKRDRASSVVSAASTPSIFVLPFCTK